MRDVVYRGNNVDDLRDLFRLRKDFVMTHGRTFDQSSIGGCYSFVALAVAWALEQIPVQTLRTFANEFLNDASMMHLEVVIMKDGSSRFHFERLPVWFVIDAGKVVTSSEPATHERTFTYYLCPKAGAKSTQLFAKLALAVNAVYGWWMAALEKMYAGRDGWFSLNVWSDDDDSGDVVALVVEYVGHLVAIVRHGQSYHLVDSQKEAPIQMENVQGGWPEVVKRFMNLEVTPVRLVVARPHMVTAPPPVTTTSPRKRRHSRISHEGSDVEEDIAEKDVYDLLQSLSEVLTSASAGPTCASTSHGPTDAASERTT